MSFTHSITEQYADSSGTISKSRTATAGGEQRIQDTIAIGATVQEVSVAFVRAKVSAIFINSDQVLTLTFKNAADASVGVLTTVANIPAYWMSGSYPLLANFITPTPLSDDVAKILVANASGVIANLDIRVLFDPTV